MKLILSISGGGIRGLIPAIILKEIERRTGKKISDMFDLISGNSTGGIIAYPFCLFLLKIQKPKYSAESIVKMYEKFGKRNFQQNFFQRKVLSLDGLISPKYSGKTFRKTTKALF